MTKIDFYAFNDCKNVAVTYKGNKYSDIEQFTNAFEYGNVEGFEIENGLLISYHGNSSSIVIPDNVTKIGDNAFEGCTNLTSITIPNSVTEIGSSVFKDCTSLTSITIPNSVTEIGEYAFDTCKSLTSITISNSVTKINRGTFGFCTSLVSMTIPNSVTEIEGPVFGFCTSLTSITIPDSVAAIVVNMAFMGCTSLTNATYKGKTYDFDHIEDLYKAVNGN